MKSALMRAGLILAAAPLLLANGPQFELPEPSSFVCWDWHCGLGFAIGAVAAQRSKLVTAV